jgi:hypothetical protein
VGYGARGLTITSGPLRFPHSATSRWRRSGIPGTSTPRLLLVFQSVVGRDERRISVLEASQHVTSRHVAGGGVGLRVGDSSRCCGPGNVGRCPSARFALGLGGKRRQDADDLGGSRGVRPAAPLDPTTIISIDYRIEVSEPKTPRGRRSVALDSGTVAALRAHRAFQNQQKLKPGPGQGLCGCRGGI